MTPSGLRGVLNDAPSIYFPDATLASAFLARWCAGHRGHDAGEPRDRSIARSERYVYAPVTPHRAALAIPESSTKRRFLTRFGR